MMRRDRLLQTFLALIAIDSPSTEEGKVAKFIAKKLKSLGGRVSFDTYGNIIATFEGKGEPVLLNAHLDTVEPGRNIKPVAKNGVIRSNGKTVLGADPKAGVAIILEAIASLKENQSAHFPLEVVLTREEEVGLRGARKLEYQRLLSNWGITFDGIGGVNNVTISSPSYSRVDVTVTGRSAHAGAEPEKGISAIQIASQMIANLTLGRIDEETTANIGLIRGGSIRNAVPETVTFHGEIRSRNLEKLEAHITHFKHVFKMWANGNGARVAYTIEKEFDTYRVSENHAVLLRIVEALKRLGLQPTLHHSGGGTDANIFRAKGIDAFVVGCGFYNAHTTREYVVIDEMLQAAAFCEKLVTVT